MKSSHCRHSIEEYITQAGIFHHNLTFNANFVWRNVVEMKLMGMVAWLMNVGGIP